jgi:hypothetical protein
VTLSREYQDNPEEPKGVKIMRLSLGAARNLAVGIVFALALAYGATPLYAACEATLECGVGCACEAGACWLDSFEGAAYCECEGLPMIICDCEQGCYYEE